MHALKSVSSVKVPRTIELFLQKKKRKQYNHGHPNRYFTWTNTPESVSPLRYTKKKSPELAFLCLVYLKGIYGAGQTQFQSECNDSMIWYSMVGLEGPCEPVT